MFIVEIIYFKNKYLIRVSTRLDDRNIADNIVCYEARKKLYAVVPSSLQLMLKNVTSDNNNVIVSCFVLRKRY